MQGGSAGTRELWDELGDHLARVEVDTKRYDRPESLVSAVQKATRAKGVALVPPNDAYLRQVGGAQLIPDRERRHQVYRALSGPGAGAEKAAETSAAKVATSTGNEEPSVTWP